VGILGPGRLARSFLTGLASSVTESAVAVGSRDVGRARAAADDFGVPRAYGSYEELLADEGGEAVYVALPNAGRVARQRGHHRRPPPQRPREAPGQPLIPPPARLWTVGPAVDGRSAGRGGRARIGACPRRR